MKSNYALGLVVGVKNQFTKGSKEIQEEYKKLSKSNAKLQENLKDIAAYEKVKAELKSYRQEIKKMNQPTEEAEMKLKALTGSLSSYSRRLKKAGVDTSDLTFEQEKLQKQLKRTTSAMNNASNASSSMFTMASEDTLAGAAASGTVVGALSIEGIMVNRAERNAAASTGMSLNDVQDWRDDIVDIESKTSLPYQQILNAKMQARQSGYSGDEAQELAMETSKLAAVFTQWDPREILPALTRTMKSMDITAAKAADLLAVTAQKSGDDKGDLLETFTEYMPLFAGKGLSAESIAAQFLAGKKAGAFNYDKVGDSIKEMLQAKMTDPTEFAKLVGDGKNQGDIDKLITNKEAAESFKNAVYDLRYALENGGDINKEYSDVMMQMAGFYQTDKGAARNIAEGVFGNIGAEDLGNRVIQKMAEASANPNAVLGDYKGTLDEAINTAISPTQKLMTSLSSLFRNVSTSVTELENAFEGVINTVSNGITTISESAGDNPLIAAALATSASLASFMGASKGYKLIKGRYDKFFPGDETQVKSAPKSSGRFSRLIGGAGKIVKPLGMVLGAGALAKSAYDGDYQETGKLAGSLAGGLAGAQLGAMAGALAGPLGIAAGGLLGGALGSVIGEESISALMNYISPNTDKEIKEATTQASEGEIALAKNNKLESQSLQINIDAPLTIESGTTVPDDFEERFNAMLRNATPGMVEQLRETMNNQVMS